MTVNRFCLPMTLCAALTASTADFRLPEGFQIQRACEAGAVRFPMFGALANDGRLFVTESSGDDLYEELRKQTRLCRISVLQDLDGNGHFEKVAVFAEQLVPSMGIAWKDGKLYAADPPDLITLEDTNGDGRADKRTVVLTGFGHTDNGSLHGLTFGPDGWLYMTMGSPDGFKLKRADGTFVEGKSGALIRCKPDGSDVEVLCRGFENLVEIVFMPDGEIVGTLNWFSLPQDGVRDALVHLVPGGTFPLNAYAKAEPINFFSGELLPAISLYPAVAHSGLMRYEGSAFPDEYMGSLFSAQFNTRKIVRHKLTRKGATFQSADEDFLSTDDPDFHPSDVLEDRDGSLLVIDTGSWYVHHCPTGRIRKTPARGGIYRVRHREPRQNIRATIRPRFRGPQDVAVGYLKEKDASARLVGVEALAICGTTNSVAALADVLATTTNDPVLKHAAIYALHRTASLSQVKQMLRSAEPEARRAALIILDQAPHKALTGPEATRALSDANANVRAAAISAFSKHKDWAPLALESTLDLLAKNDVAAVKGLAGAAGGAPEVRAAIATAIADESRAAAVRVALLDIASGTEADEKLALALKKALRAKDQSVVEAALRCRNALNVRGLDDEMRAIAADSKAPVGLRLQSLRPLAGSRPGFDAGAFAFLKSCLDQTNPPSMRLAAAEIAAAGKLDPAQVEEFFRTVKNDRLVSPQLVAAVAKMSGVEEGAELAEYLRQTQRKSGDDQKMLSQLEPLLAGGDENRGQQIYLGKAACAACHRVGKHGGLVGPDLTRVGAIRSGRDLIESLALPSATFAQGYEPYRVELVSGDILNGVRVRQLDDSFVLRDASGAETRLRAEEIKRAERGEVSTMPEGLLNILTREEIRDLLAYLQKLK